MTLNILTNPIVAGTLTVMFTGWAMVVAKDVPKAILRWLRNRVVCVLEVTNDGPAYEWVKAWLGDTATRARWLQAGISADPKDDVIYNQKRRPRFFLSPRGMSIFRYRGKRILAWSWKEPLANASGWRETITFQAFGGRGIFAKLLDDAYDHACRKNGATIEVWVPYGTEWRLAERKSARTLTSLCLTRDVHRNVFDDARRFLDQREWYADMGIPYRRGYLLHGPPGNGKSSIAHALASELKVGINVANLSAFSNDTQLIECLSRVPSGNILLLEDIDAAYTGRKADGVSLTFSGLLNALDGVTARDGQIVLMTTNHADKLDPALVRPGRADVHVFIDNASSRQAAQMFRRFFPGEPDSAASLFAAEVGSVSMANIQERLLRNRDNPADAIRGSAERELIAA